MYSGSATLIVDLGNSETRIKVRLGKRESDVKHISNQFALIANSYEIPSDYENSESLVFNTTLEGNKVRVANGSLALREFNNYLMKPSATEPKWKAQTSFLSLHAALYHGYCIISDMVGSPVDSLDINWTVVVLSPPVQMAQKENLIALFKSVKELSVESPVTLNYQIRFDNLMVMPEGVMAFNAVVFNERHGVRSGMAPLVNGSVMILDVGAGTTDLCILQGARVIQDSLDTYPVGGNNVYQQVGRDLKREGRNIGEIPLMQGVIDGFIKDGNSKVDITDKIERAKTRVAQALQNNVRRSMEAALLDPRSVEYLLVVGGGAIESNTTSLGKYLLKVMKDLSPNIELVSVPEGLDLRHLNIEGVALATAMK